MTYPFITHLKQTQPQPRIDSLVDAVRAAWIESKVKRQIQPGMKIAVGVGSRGIKDIAIIAKTTIDTLRFLGASPFLVPAMGSHGGATAEGQLALLADYGITAAAMGCEIRSSMETVQIGTNSWGEPVFWDRNAYESDGVVTLSRIKPHTDYIGPYESGIVKMAVIGLGKRDGANQHHRWGWKGLRDQMPESMKTILEKTKFLGGLGILENAHEQTARLEVIDRDDLMTREPELLADAKQLIGRIPFAELDVLIIGEIGKNYSGCGIDPNVIGRFLVEAAPEMETAKPRITRIAALDLSPESHGNGVGMGLADLITERFLKDYRPEPTRINAITACFLWRAKQPFACATDRECIQTAIETSWQPIPEKLKLAIIPNTLEVSEMWVTDALVTEAQQLLHLQVGERIEMPIKENTLLQERLFPHSVRGKRKM
jgi:hypothetical protein